MPAKSSMRLRHGVVVPFAFRLSKYSCSAKASARTVPPGKITSL